MRPLTPTLASWLAFACALGCSGVSQLPATSASRVRVLAAEPASPPVMSVEPAVASSAQGASARSPRVPAARIGAPGGTGAGSRRVKPSASL